ncbi:hypothetical protein ABT174_00385 [Streptomyces sparsogenes]|uniref:hypothetical protein n=1 Tax=Streptomyces sparsogenes TaxID=67365 RepID=UPI00331C90E0
MWAAVGSVLYLALIALIGLGVATAVRDAARAIGIVLGLLYLFPVVTQPIGPWAGLGVLATWTNRCRSPRGGLGRGRPVVRAPSE